MMSLPKMQEAKERYASVRAKNYTQLINKEKNISIKKKILMK